MVRDHCTLSGGRLILVQKKDEFCTFYEGTCTIHPVKPRMCRRWPYIESVLVDIRNWNSMATMCRGIRTDLPDEIIAAAIRDYLAIE
jgi:Fe-S-cluster containining protein